MSGAYLDDWVLILDDDPWAVELTKVMLESHDIPVHAAHTIDAALDSVRRLGPPSVLLLDVMMPEADGFEVCRRLRAEGALRHTRVVFVTALDDEASKLTALEAGADDMISKPFSEPILIARVRSLIELARLRDRDQARLEYDAVLETIGEGVITLDEHDRVITANGPARRLLGLPDDPLDRTHLPAFVAQHWTVDRGAIGRSTQARIRWQDRGPSLAVALDWTSRELPGSATTHATWTVVVRDATDAWERDRALGRLTRTFGHKLRTPLTGVTTGLEILADSTGLDEDGAAILELAQEAADRLRDTLIRIMEFTAASTEAQGPPQRDLLLPCALDEQLGLEEDVEVEARLTQPVIVDLNLVRRGVTELVTNARHAGARHIRVTVADDPGGLALFAVTDDGPGLPPGITERIFESFYQTDRSGEGAGAGLGLAILAAEVERGGGTVGAHAPLDGNTTVWFRIPAGVAAARRA